MSLYRVDADATRTLDLPEVAVPRCGIIRAIRAWLSREGLTTGGVAVSLALYSTFLTFDLLAPQDLPPRTSAIVDAAGCLWLQILIICKWGWDKRRTSSNESRALQEQADLRSLVTLLRTEVVELRKQSALMRAEMHALLEMLPDGVIKYADRHAVEVSITALQKLAATGTEDTLPPADVAPVTSITQAKRSRQN